MTQGKVGKKRIDEEVTGIRKKVRKKGDTKKKWFKNITWIRDQGSRYGHFSSSTKDAGSRGATYYLCICFGCQNVHKFATMYIKKSKVCKSNVFENTVYQLLYLFLTFHHLCQPISNSLKIKTRLTYTWEKRVRDGAADSYGSPKNSDE